MADIRLTAAQQAVVDSEGGALLVSAAAGSGKTKVLVDRLLKRVLEGSQPHNIDEFLVITYTKAAASELRLKIAQELSRRLAAAPDDRHLQHQLHRIYLAEISTVHAFCGNLLRTYAHLLDLPADFRVAEEAEAQALREKVLDTLLEELYTAEDSDFLAMASIFGYGRDDRRLPGAILQIQQEMRCRPDMTRWRQETRETLDLSRYGDAAETPWGAYLLSEFRRFLTRQIEKFQAALQEMAQYPKIEKGLAPCFTENLRQLEALLSCESWDAVVSGRVETFGRVGTVRQPEDAAVKERLSKVRSLCWSELKAWQELFFAPSQAVLADLRETTGALQTLLDVAAQFDEAYAAEKARRRVLDFSDLEHQAIRLLVDRYTGAPTATAREVASRYREILVDEYQDSNAVQDVIFEAISQGGQNRFMVGDVKQSIYRFRLADPGLFLQKYEAYPDEADAQPGEPRKILLSENFRSRPEILAACNQVFSLVMRRRVGGLDYTAREALRPGRSFPPLPDCPVELHCLTHTGAVAPEKSRAEAQFVAGRIREMLAAGTPVTEGEGLRPMRPGDVVILMRSLSSTANVYLEALSQAGIPAVCDRGGSLLETSEVQILLALLQLIDNPHQDIPLLTVLASPVFGFTPEQLAKPRTKERREDLFDAITAYGGDFAPFLELLEALREDAKWMRLQELMESIFRRTGFLSVFAAMDDGLGRERNLLAFESFVISFEQGGAKALPDLLWHLQELQESGGQLPVPKAGGGDAVRLMTIHSSKGLEFPVVFLADLSRKFNLQDMREAILVDSDLALGCNRVDTARFVRYPTLAKSAIVRKKTAEAVSEELRVLYVAMTRAKDRLVMTYYSRRLQQELKNLASQLTMPPSEELCAAATCPGHWILLSALCRTEAGALFALAGESPASQVWADTWRITAVDLAEYEAVSQAETAAPPPPTPDLEGLALLGKPYPHLEAAAIPAKVTATQLKGRIPDQEAAEGAVVKAPPDFSFRRPSFLPHKLTPAERGVATHLFMQFARYERLTTPSGIAAERQRLLEEAFLTAEQLEAVDEKAVLAFFTAPLGQWLLSQEEVRREFKFSLLVDAAEVGYQVEGETLMLQGVVDCFVVEPDGLTILDFKTDRVGEKTVKARAQDYTPQIRAYGKALSTIYHLPVKRLILYFFATGTAVEVEA